MIALFLALAAAAGGTVEADVLARTVARGEVLNAADFDRAAIPATAAALALRAADAAGKEARRSLPAGSTLRASDLVVPRVVRRGEAVTLRYISGGIVISAPGKALGDAGAGEPVRVANLATGRTIEARAIASGAVEIEPR